MRRILLQAAPFVRAARRLVKKHPEAAPILQAAFEALAKRRFSARAADPQVKGRICGLLGV